MVSRMLDIYLLAINIMHKEEQPEYAGFLVSVPPKRVARGRGDDILVLFASAPGEDFDPGININQVLSGLADTFYRTSGSVTSAFQSIILQFNELLLKENARDKMGGQVLARLNIGVVRRDTLYLAQAGSTHTYVLNQGEVIDHYDPQAMPRALGLGRSVTPRFYQQQIENGSICLLCAEPPAAWNENLTGSGAHFSLESLRRRLVHRTDENLQALIIQFKSGSGAIHILHRRAATESASAAEALPSMHEPEIREVVKEVLPAAQMMTGEEIVQPDIKDHTISPLDTLGEVLSEKLLGLREKTAEGWQKRKGSLKQLRYAIATLFTRLLPGVSEKPIEIPTGTMLFIAIAVPLVVVAMAMTVYFRSGREGEHRRYMDMALNTAVQAQSAPDTNLQKEYWRETLGWLDKAEVYGQSDESVALRGYVRETLDRMDGITRAGALPALKDNLPSSVQITRLAAIGTDVYALDANEGKVWRFFLTSSGYEIDADFTCSLDPSMGSATLVDIVSLPPVNPLKATVMAMDTRGNLIYCAPGEPASSAMLTPPSTGWGEIIAFTLKLDTLYILDRGSNAVWRMARSKDFTYDEEPALYFEHDIPQRLSEVIDLAIAEDELFLLRGDGTMISCLYQPMTKEVCTDPAPYGDLRPGREQQPLIFPEVNFIQMLATSPPDPSIYMLDTNHGTVYQFSLRLNLIRQLMPEFAPNYLMPQKEPSAFTVTPNRILVMAFTNTLYFASLP